VMKIFLILPECLPPPIIYMLKSYPASVDGIRIREMTLGGTWS
jgi:hypothetical protein